MFLVVYIDYEEGGVVDEGVEEDGGADKEPYRFEE